MRKLLPFIVLLTLVYTAKAQYDDDDCCRFRVAGLFNFTKGPSCDVQVGSWMDLGGQWLGAFGGLKLRAKEFANGKTIAVTEGRQELMSTPTTPIGTITGKIFVTNIGFSEWGQAVIMPYASIGLMKMYYEPTRYYEAGVRGAILFFDAYRSESVALTASLYNSTDTKVGYGFGIMLVPKKYH